MRKATKATPYSRETVKQGEQWFMVSLEQVLSPAMRALGTKAIELYFVARRQERNATYHALKAGHSLEPVLYPLDQWDFLEEAGQKVPFYLNEALLVRHKEAGKRPRDWLAGITNGERIYSDAKQLKADRKKLVAFGLLDEIPVGAGIKRNIKGVYVLSSRWRELTEQDIERIKKELQRGRKVPIRAEKKFLLEVTNLSPKR